MQTYQTVVKQLLRDTLKSVRKEFNISQELMSEKLKVTPRSYSDLERGVSCLSATTLLFLFSVMSDERVIAVVKRFVETIDKTERNDNAA